MPANLLDIHEFENFLFQCTSGPYFTADNLIPEMELLSGGLGLDRYLYPLAIWVVRGRVQSLASRLGFFVKQPDWGPGRVDTFSNARGIFNTPWQRLPDWRQHETPEPDQIGTVEFPSIWRQGDRKKRSSDACPMELHWDGNNDAVEECDLSAAFGTGALPTNIDHENVERVERWLLTVSKPPKFSDFFPDKLDAELAEKGKGIYAAYCADCHGRDGEHFDGKRVGMVTPIGEIGTDRYRLDNYTEELAQTQAMLDADQMKTRRTPAEDFETDLSKCNPPLRGRAPENSYRLKRFRKTYGYANSPLDGVWLRAPYLHNGSVPSLWDLLQPAAARASVLFQGQL